MLIKTMAVKITEKTYPIAVACLGPGFVSIPQKQTYGYYLVINDVEAATSQDGLGTTLLLSNKWMNEKDFRDLFEFVDGELKTNFAEVRPI